ncbi:universal stress protein [Flavisolibacter tropicus]|uniref:UspA domain-containing protein n=1 Tax=Flavisolibacter tropicus TaxID=1492898 RepID=A0A172TR59_9BACT|nr:universal stress protein [Flavisolibacter tropicus]ANE49569.1 hypothetical protein SY85_02680 [Flavisolibacter tropicus]
MEKILLIMNSHKADTKIIDFGCYIALLTESKLTGVLVEDTTLELASHDHQQSYYRKVKVRDDQSILMDSDQLMRYFSQECRLRGISSIIYSDKGSPMEEVLYESRFADLMIVTPNLFNKSTKEEIPSTFVKKILSKAECPVVVAPNEFKGIEEIVFCFDASASSLFAIKEFTYLFPQFQSKKITVLEVRNDILEEMGEDVAKTREWLEAHYQNVHFRFLEGDVKDELFTYFLLKKDTFIVMGSFGRNMISQLYKKSASETIIKTIDLPIFITHH